MCVESTTVTETILACLTNEHNCINFVYFDFRTNQSALGFKIIYRKNVLRVPLLKPRNIFKTLHTLLRKFQSVAFIKTKQKDKTCLVVINHLSTNLKR